MQKIKKSLLLLNDVLLLYISLAVALLIRYGATQFHTSFSAHIVPFSALFLGWIIVFYLSDFYSNLDFETPSRIGKSLAQNIFFTGILSIIFLYLFPDFFKLTPKTNLLLVSAVFFALAYLARISWLKALASGSMRLVAFGNSAIIEKLILHLNTHPFIGYRVSEWKKEFSDEDLSIEAIRKIKTEILLIDPSLLKNKGDAAKIYDILRSGIRVFTTTEFYEYLFEKIPLENINTEWFIDHVLVNRPFYDALKRVVDFTLAFLIGIVLLLPSLIIAVIIVITSRGPAIFSQTRSGKNGKEFTLHKFRTMKHNAGGPLWTEANDARITFAGKALRKTHLDEIPQLWNILKGDLSFTGPRPERTELVKQYEKFPFYHSRHIVKPGLTGWAQINFRPSASLEEAFEKLKYDIFYIKNRSLFLDILIILKTIRYIFTSHK